MSVVSAYVAVVATIKSILLGLAFVAAAICLFDWAVRTRRISPFNRAARFFRDRIDPLMRPVERTVVRAGGLPSSAPWWTLVAVIVGGILLVSILGLGATVLTQVVVGFHDPALWPRILGSWAFTILRMALLVRVLSSWLPISPFSRWVRWSFVLTDWMVIPLRRVIPLVGAFDLSPLVAWLLLDLLQGALGLR